MKARIRFVDSPICACMTRRIDGSSGKAVAQMAADLLRAPPPKQKLGESPEIVDGSRASLVAIARRLSPGLRRSAIPTRSS